MVIRSRSASYGREYFSHHLSLAFDETTRSFHVDDCGHAVDARARPLVVSTGIEIVRALKVHRLQLH